jgi:hypothetical protein
MLSLGDSPGEAFRAEKISVLQEIAAEADEMIQRKAVENSAAR